MPRGRFRDPEIAAAIRRCHAEGLTVPSWRECFNAGMTAPEAAAERGRAINAAYSWSSRHGLTWPKPVSKCRIPVRIRGTVYPSIAAAAEALGIDQSIICHHLRTYGHADLVGLLKRGGQRGKGGDHLKNPVHLCGRTWESRVALAKEIGWPRSRVSRALCRQGNHRLRANLLEAIMLADAEAARAPQQFMKGLIREAPCSADVLLDGSQASAEVCLRASG